LALVLLNALFALLLLVCDRIVTVSKFVDRDVSLARRTTGWKETACAPSD
jgi:hypothetical protein